MEQRSGGSLNSRRVSSDCMFLFILQAFGINMNSRKPLFEVSSQAFMGSNGIPGSRLYTLLSYFFRKPCSTGSVGFRLVVYSCQVTFAVVQLDFPRAASQHKI